MFGVSVVRFELILGLLIVSKHLRCCHFGCITNGLQFFLFVFNLAIEMVDCSVSLIACTCAIVFHFILTLRWVEEEASLVVGVVFLGCDADYAGLHHLSF